MHHKTCFLFGTLFVSAAITSGCFSHRSMAQKAHQAAKAATTQETDDAKFTVREEFRQSFTLKAGASVEINRINGSLDVETTEGNTAEILIVRLAKDQETLAKRKTRAVYANNHLRIIGNYNDNQGLWDEFTGNGEIRTNATIKLPRTISLSVESCNGKATIGAIDNDVEAHGINGRLNFAQIGGRFELSGLNGNAQVTLLKAGKSEVNIHGINGNIDLRFATEVNANLEVHGINGRVNAELPNVKVEEQKHSNYRAVIGAGGANIEVEGMNGNLSLAKAGVTDPSMKSTASASPVAPHTVVERLSRSLKPTASASPAAPQATK